jgi:hypothetical protein
MKQFTPPEIAKAFVLISFSALSALAVTPAQAVVLDFESLAVNDGNAHYPGSSYTEDGFNVAASGDFATWGTQMSFYPGSTTLFEDYSGTTTLSQVNGGAFTLSSIEIGNVYNSGVSNTINFTGLRADNTTVGQSFTTDSLPGLQNVVFFNFTNLVSVNWTTQDQFDNINVSAANTTSVPEPFTVLGTLFGAGYGVALKRKLAKAQADKEDIS